MQHKSQQIRQTVLIMAGICLGVMSTIPAAEAALTMNGIKLNGMSFNTQSTSTNTTASTQSLRLQVIAPLPNVFA